jgi:hypothetical protein
MTVSVWRLGRLIQGMIFQTEQERPKTAIWIGNLYRSSYRNATVIAEEILILFKPPVKEKT